MFTPQARNNVSFKAALFQPRPCPVPGENEKKQKVGNRNKRPVTISE